MAWKAFSFAILFVKLALLYVFGNILKNIPCIRKFIIKKMNRKASIVMPVDNYWNTLFSWNLIQTLWKYEKNELNRASKIGCTAPNPILIAGTKGQSVVHLLDLVKPNRPLVVIFGSCTCPVIIAKLEQMLQVQREFEDIADFILVYVQEAHPQDGWRMKNTYVVRRHVSIEDRVEASQILRAFVPTNFPVYSDTLDNAASTAFSGCPNRIAIIEEDKLIYQNGPGPTWFDFEETKQCLKRYRNNNKA